MGDIPAAAAADFFLLIAVSRSSFILCLSLSLYFGVSENLVLEMRRQRGCLLFCLGVWCDTLVGSILAAVNRLTHSS